MQVPPWSDCGECASVKSLDESDKAALCQCTVVCSCCQDPFIYKQSVWISAVQMVHRGAVQHVSGTGQPVRDNPIMSGSARPDGGQVLITSECRGTFTSAAQSDKVSASSPLISPNENQLIRHFHPTPLDWLLTISYFPNGQTSTTYIGTSTRQTRRECRLFIDGAFAKFSGSSIINGNETKPATGFTKF